MMNNSVTVVIDNNGDPSSNLFTEHGLSFYFEIDNKKWMVDVGASKHFIENAEMMGIDITDIDFLILSHAHADHTGGLGAFLQRNSKAKVFLSANIGEKKYYSIRRGPKRNISIDLLLLHTYADRFVFIDSTTVVSPSVSLLCPVPDLYDKPKANSTLLADDSLDDFNHEIITRIRNSDGTHLISSCSHSGILNTLALCQKDESVTTYIGGLHLIDSDETHCYETYEELQQIGKTIHENYPGLTIYTGHCTGKEAIRCLTTTLNDSIKEFHTGYKIPI